MRDLIEKVLLEVHEWHPGYGEDTVPVMERDGDWTRIYPVPWSPVTDALAVGYSGA